MPMFRLFIRWGWINHSLRSCNSGCITCSRVHSCLGSFMRMSKGMIIKICSLLEANLGPFCLWGLTTNYKLVLTANYKHFTSVFCPQTSAHHCRVAQDAAGCIWFCCLPCLLANSLVSSFIYIYIYIYIYFFFFFFSFWLLMWHMEVPGQELNAHHRNDQSCCSDKAGSLTHCIRGNSWLVFFRSHDLMAQGLAYRHTSEILQLWFQTNRVKHTWQ